MPSLANSCRGNSPVAAVSFSELANRQGNASDSHGLPWISYLLTRPALLPGFAVHSEGATLRRGQAQPDTRGDACAGVDAFAARIVREPSDATTHHAESPIANTADFA